MPAVLSDAICSNPELKLDTGITGASRRLATGSTNVCDCTENILKGINAMIHLELTLLDTYWIKIASTFIAVPHCSLTLVRTRRLLATA